MATRTRYSIEYLQELYDRGDHAPLDNLIRAFRGIQALPPDNKNSFFCISGYHGMPFRGPGEKDGVIWWGGYCWHDSVLFPTWHRAYLLNLEDALRSIPGCQDVTIPYWDELAHLGSDKTVPTIFTQPTYNLDNQEIPNPLYSYKLQHALEDLVKGAAFRYSKAEGYETVRYPLSGLVGTEKDRVYSNYHNGLYPNAADNVKTLNQNVANWLEGTVNIPDDEHHTKKADTYSAAKRYFRCLDAPNYTIFSNTASQNQWIEDHKDPDNPYPVASLEAGHNAIHLAVGGFYQEGVYNADPIQGANGDMGDNETAAFDPIFYFHHAFVDYVFWVYQRRKDLTKRGSLSVYTGYPGTILEQGQPPNFKPNTYVDMDTPLMPFEKPNGGGYYTSHDVTDINELGYVYAPGSLEPLAQAPKSSAVEHSKEPPIHSLKKVSGINRTEVSGSFVIRLYAETHGGNMVEVGGEPILSRRNIQGCANCQNHLDVVAYIPVYKVTHDLLQGHRLRGVLKWHADIHTRDKIPVSKEHPTLNAPRVPRWQEIPDQETIERSGLVVEDS